MGIRPVSRSTQWIVPFLTPRSLSRKPRWRTCVGWFLRNHVSEKKWPILDNRTDQLSKQRPGKATIFFLRPCCHQFCKLWLWQIWSCLPSSQQLCVCFHPEYKWFQGISLSDKFQRPRCAVVREGGNRRSNSAEEDHDFCFVSVQSESFETCMSPKSKSTAQHANCQPKQTRI